MKELVILLLPFMMATSLFGQDTKEIPLPSVDVKTMDGKSFNTKDIENGGNPTIVSFWALWCKPCIKELTTISEVYDDWKTETGVKFIAVSIDDARSTSRVMPFVNGKGWEYDFLLDPNGDFKRAMNVNLIPHTFILNGKNEIVWQHTSFAEGNELQLIELVRKVKAGEEITE